MRDTPSAAPRLRATMETMHAAGRRTLPPVPRAGRRGRYGSADTPTERLSPEPFSPAPPQPPGDPSGLESDAAQRFVARLRSAAADFAAAAGAGSAVVREAVPPARHRRSRCRVVLRYADGTETDVTFLGPAGEPGSPVPARVRPADPALAGRRAAAGRRLAGRRSGRPRRGRRRRHRLGRRRLIPAGHRRPVVAFAVGFPSAPRWATMGMPLDDSERHGIRRVAHGARTGGR